MEEHSHPYSAMKTAPYREVPCIDALYPKAPTGPVSVRCKEPGCTWEAMYVMPEEVYRYIGGILFHMRDAHGAKLPAMSCETW